MLWVALYMQIREKRANSCDGAQGALVNGTGVEKLILKNFSQYNPYLWLFKNHILAFLGNFNLSQNLFSFSP